MAENCPTWPYRGVMRNPIGTIVALAVVLTAGVAGAVVNTQAASVPAAASADVSDADLAASTTGYQDAGLVTDIATYDSYPAPVIQVVEVLEPAPEVAAQPTASTHRRVRHAAKHASRHSHEDSDDGEDEHESEDD